MLKSATLQQTGGKLICTLITESDEQLVFGLAGIPDLKFGKDPKADNTHVDITMTVRVSNLVTYTEQPELPL